MTINTITGSMTIDSGDHINVITDDKQEIRLVATPRQGNDCRKCFFNILIRNRPFSDVATCPIAPTCGYCILQPNKTRRTEKKS